MGITVDAARRAEAVGFDADQAEGRESCDKHIAEGKIDQTTQFRRPAGNSRWL
jgi:hypothetical protein